MKINSGAFRNKSYYVFKKWGEGAIRCSVYSEK